MSSKNFVFTEMRALCQIPISFHGYILYNWVIQLMILGRSLFLAIELSPKSYFGHQTPKLISLAIELSKPDNFGHKAGLKMVALPIYVFCKDNGNMIKSLKTHNCGQENLVVQGLLFRYRR